MHLKQSWKTFRICVKLLIFTTHKCNFGEKDSMKSSEILQGVKILAPNISKLYQRVSGSFRASNHWSCCRTCNSSCLAWLQQCNFPFLCLLGEFNPNTKSIKLLMSIWSYCTSNTNMNLCFTWKEHFSLFKPINPALRLCLCNIHTNIPWGFRSKIHKHLLTEGSLLLSHIWLFHIRASEREQGPVSQLFFSTQEVPGIVGR